MNTIDKPSGEQPAVQARISALAALLSKGSDLAKEILGFISDQQAKAEQLEERVAELQRQLQVANAGLVEQAAGVSSADEQLREQLKAALREKSDLKDELAAASKLIDEMSKDKASLERRAAEQETLIEQLQSRVERARTRARSAISIVENEDVSQQHNPPAIEGGKPE